MSKDQLKKLIDTAAGRIPAQAVIKNARVVDVFGGGIIRGDIAIVDGVIAGVGEYQGETVYEAEGLYAAPGFIDSHIHIESSYVTPEEIGRLLVPCGTTTIIADPHEIVNVKGGQGMEYMLEAAKETALDIQYMLPSCVPATAFENSGGAVGAEDIRTWLKDGRVLGLGEFMNYRGVVRGEGFALDCLAAGLEAGVSIDGHSPRVEGKDLNAYAAAGIITDHECTTVEEMRDRISRGMYVLMRHGSACHDLENLLEGVTESNAGRCMLCSDDRQPKTILEHGHLDHHLRLCVSKGITPLNAIRMATLNAAQCYGLSDRGAISPGRRADIVLLHDLESFKAAKVFICGELTAEHGKYLPPVKRRDASAMRSSFFVKDFSADKLRLKLTSDKVHTIELVPGGVVTKKTVAVVKRDAAGDFVYDPGADIVKMVVVERHKNTGNVAVALLRGYGIKSGAVALSVAHDSHNIIAAGVSNEEIEFAVQALIGQGGGILLAKDGKVLEAMPLPVAGIMCEQSGEWVDAKLTEIHRAAHESLGISGDVEPVMTLCFMALPVIPEIKLTDMGLFDVTSFNFSCLEAE
ncbi:MAG: adenine deaminase [Defluviitaleaceae bacterium]|nr:adenine deaminase [Defluviitaleaceae bacterium]